MPGREPAAAGSGEAGAEVNGVQILAERDLSRPSAHFDYATFIRNKAQQNTGSGFEPLWMPSFLFDFQSWLVDWNLRTGRSATFADCGLGKTPMELVWAENVHRKTNKPVLLLTALAVAPQIVREADKFGVQVMHSRDGKNPKGIVVANYEKLHLFNRDDFAGVVCDESSILKSFDGARRQEITDFARALPYRLLETATAAPNDYIELGTSSEALGYLGHMDMLMRFFKNDQNSINAMRSRRFGAGAGEAPKWRFKGHAELPFWQWVCSWARAVRKPSDLGFDDGRFVLPALIEREHMVEARTIAEGMLFSLPAVGLKEQRDERRRTVNERCEKAAELVGKHETSIAWCHLNDEGDLLESLIPGAVQVSGDDADEAKEEKFLAFASGQIKRLVTKYKIGAWGLNWQHCNHMTTFPSHSFEQYYQGVRRCLRFGQERPVEVDIVTTEGEQKVLENFQRKARQADVMFTRLVSEMNRALNIERETNYTKPVEIPEWL